jgi:hypothetical protein
MMTTLTTTADDPELNDKNVTGASSSSSRGCPLLFDCLVPHEDILDHILSYLDVPSLVYWDCTCKKSSKSTTRVWQSHSQRQPVNAVCTALIELQQYYTTPKRQSILYHRLCEYAKKMERNNITKQKEEEEEEVVICENNFDIQVFHEPEAYMFLVRLATINNNNYGDVDDDVNPRVLWEGLVSPVDQGSWGESTIYFFHMKEIDENIKWTTSLQNVLNYNHHPHDDYDDDDDDDDDDYSSAPRLVLRHEQPNFDTADNSDDEEDAEEEYLPTPQLGPWNNRSDSISDDEEEEEDADDDDNDDDNDDDDIHPVNRFQVAAKDAFDQLLLTLVAIRKHDDQEEEIEEEETMKSIHHYYKPKLVIASQGLQSINHDNRIYYHMHRRKFNSHSSIGNTINNNNDIETVVYPRLVTSENIASNDESGKLLGIRLVCSGGIVSSDTAGTESTLIRRMAGRHHHQYRLPWQLSLCWNLLLCIICIVSKTTSSVQHVDAYTNSAGGRQPQQRHPSSRQANVANKIPLSFRQFKFAPNGVCIYPQYFVEYRDTADGDDGDVDVNNNKGSQQPTYFTMRNVPGDGDCMFMAVALSAANSMGLGGNDSLLRAISRETRNIVAQILSSTGNLYISPGNVVEASRLLQSAVQQEPSINTAEEYLEALRKEGRDGGLYGGGPELAVLSNVLRRPISIFEVDKQRLRDFIDGQSDENIDNKNDDDNNMESFLPIVCKGSFGEVIFEDPCITSIHDSALLSNIQPGAFSWRLHILVLDVSPGEKHACVLMPQTIIPSQEKESNN